MALFCMPLLPVLERTREELEQKWLKSLPNWTISASEWSNSHRTQWAWCLACSESWPESVLPWTPAKRWPSLRRGTYRHWKKIALLEGVDVRIAERGGLKVVGVPIGADAYAMESAMEIVENGGVEQLARMLLHMPYKQSANLIATGSMEQRTVYIERVMDPELSLPACQKEDNSTMWMLENLLDISGAA